MPGMSVNWICRVALVEIMSPVENNNVARNGYDKREN
jgi:hypothetical protein